jgi:hypothetical protein
MEAIQEVLCGLRTDCPLGSAVRVAVTASVQAEYRNPHKGLGWSQLQLSYCSDAREMSGPRREFVAGRGPPASADSQRILAYRSVSSLAQTGFFCRGSHQRLQTLEKILHGCPTSPTYVRRRIPGGGSLAAYVYSHEALYPRSFTKNCPRTPHYSMDSGAVHNGAWVRLLFLRETASKDTLGP